MTGISSRPWKSKRRKRKRIFALVASGEKRRIKEAAWRWGTGWLAIL